MPRVSKNREISPKRKSLFIDDFYSAITSLKDKTEARAFFEDLLTSEEKLMLSKRFQISMMLELDYSWEEIAQRVKIINTTILRQKLRLAIGCQGLRKIAKRIIGLKEKKKESFGKRSKDYLGPAIIKAGIGSALKRKRKINKQKSITKS